MKNLINKILKEELSDDDLNWIREIDPIDDFTKWVEEQSLYSNFNNKKDGHWLVLIENTRTFIDELKDETNTLLEYVENIDSSAGLVHSGDMLDAVEEMLGNNNGSSVSYIVELFRDGQIYLRTFLENFGSYGDKYDLTLEQLLNLSHKYFERQVYGDKKNSETLKEYNDREKRSTTEITMSLLGEASDHFAQGLRLIESATQFAYEANNEDLIRDLETLRMSIQSGDDKMWAENPNSMNIINKINDIVRKYS